MSWTEDEERYGFQKMESYEVGPIEESNHPLFRKEVFIFKILASACLVLIVAIMFRNQTPLLDPARNLLRNRWKRISNLQRYLTGMNTFGKQLALLPTSDPDKIPNSENESKQMQYALPASGRILEKFGENGQRITIEIGKGANVEGDE